MGTVIPTLFKAKTLHLKCVETYIQSCITALMCEAYESTPGDCTWHYNECGPVCPETCQHRHSKNSYTCSVSMPCVEGCFPKCPNGE